MYAKAKKTKENKSRAVANAVSLKQRSDESNFQFVDNRPEAIAQRKLQEMANNSLKLPRLRASQGMTKNNTRHEQTVQRVIYEGGRPVEADRVMEWFTDETDFIAGEIPRRSHVEALIKDKKKHINLEKFESSSEYFLEYLKRREHVEEKKEAVPKLTLKYDANHGGYHFTGKVTKRKAQWIPTKPMALELMKAEIKKHMKVLIKGSKSSGWTVWYIGGHADRPIGRTVAGTTTKFCIQLQVNLKLSLISYHGYPDQRLLRYGVGKTKRSIK